MSEQEQKTNFAGLRIIAFESRRAAEMKTLIEHQNGVATVVPSMREVPHEEKPEAILFAQALLAGQLDMVIFLTGVGTRMLAQELATRVDTAQIVAALSRLTVVARGPKPVAALREWGVAVDVRVPEPNTWREVLATLDGLGDKLPLSGRHIAIQEYGMANRHLIEGLEERGAQVMRVPIYRWALPEDTEPLRQAVTDIAEGKYDVALFTTGTQVWHLFQVAAERGQEAPLRTGLQRLVVASIGPTCTEALREFEVSVDLEPEHPRMGQLVRHAAAQSQQIMDGKQAEQE